MHRPDDVYEYVATTDIMIGNACAFREGDPIPGSTVEEYDWVKEGMAVLRKDYEKRNPDEPDRPMVRGEMPAHLQESAVVPLPETDDKPKAARRPATAGTKDTSG